MMSLRPMARPLAVSVADSSPPLAAKWIPICRRMRQPTAAYGLFRPTTDQWHCPWFDLWPDRHWLHHGLRHRRHDQFCPWRHFHDRRLHRPDLFLDPGFDRAYRGAPHPFDRAVGVDGDYRALRLDSGAHRVSAVTTFVPARADA